MLKTCGKCKVEMDESNFHSMERSKDGLFPWCKKCRKAYDKSRNGTPEARARAKSKNAIPEAKAKAKIQQASPERKAAKKIYENNRLLTDPEFRLCKNLR